MTFHDDDLNSAPSPKLDELLCRAGDRDLEALSWLLLHYVGDIKSQVQVGLSSREAAWRTESDLVQSVMRAALHSVKENGLQVDGAPSFRGWLRTIARNKATDAVRDRRAEKRDGRLTVSNSDPTTRLTPKDETSKDQGPSESLDRHELREGEIRLAERALASLEQLDRELLLASLRTQSIREICSALGEDPGDERTYERVKKRLAKARSRLQRAARLQQGRGD